MTIDATQRSTLAALADVLVPAAEGMPAASEVGVAAEGLDRVLRVRPDLEADLSRVLRAGTGPDAAEQIRDLQRDDPAAFEALAMTVTGAYYTDKRVRDLIGYPGQLYDRQRLERDQIDASDPMLQRVVGRGPVYRPTPGP
ncbi:hypothetical protein ACI782_24025 [Geodermatophilus sp. SYSU D00703]